ncbi:hypothetical protein SSS_05228 [Sarcoptes scabiei]|uniref:E3 ubiquitin-protein ligase rififylin n=2 Tax=Sarcoptes scabiei TaxID=52283 RepID=A0A834R5D6_SARSC|nr:hypothetical protein SSS_05228 [Sarcoptes scabiei]
MFSSSSRNQKIPRQSTSSSSSSNKFNLNEALNSFAFTDIVGNFKDSFDELTKNIPDMEKLFSVKTSCESCSSKFGIFVRKNECSQCFLIYCRQCIDNNVDSSKKSICNRCKVFNQNPLTREALHSLKVKDLKWFLATKNVPSRHCFEKSELIDLIVAVEREISIISNPIHSSTQIDSNQDSSREAPSNNARESELNNQNIGESISRPIEESDAQKNILQSSSLKETTTRNSYSDSVMNLQDIHDHNEIKNLTIKQLKLVLARNFVDFKGCVERDELESKVLMLYQDRKINETLKDKLEKENRGNLEENQCKICWEKVIDCVLLDCGHMITCTDCGKVLSECPICRQFISRVVHVFKS